MVALLGFDLVMNSTSVGDSRLPVLVVWAVVLLGGTLAGLVARFLVHPPGAGPAGSCSGPAAAVHEEGARRHG